MAGDAAVGEEIGRVGEDEVDGGGWDLGEDVEAVALVERGEDGHDVSCPYGVMIFCYDYA